MADTSTDEQGQRPADEDAAANVKAAAEAGVNVETDANGVTKGYIGRDAADLQSEGDPGVTAPRPVTAATWEDPVPPGGHPADPTSLTAVGAAADDAQALGKADATRA